MDKHSYLGHAGGASPITYAQLEDRTIRRRTCCTTAACGPVTRSH